MQKQTLTLLSVFLVLGMALSACGTATLEAATVPESDAGSSSDAN